MITVANGDAPNGVANPNPRNHMKTKKSSLKVRTSIKAGGIGINHNRIIRG